MRRLLASLAVAALLAGCAGAAHRGVSEVKLDGAQALVIGSITYDSGQGQYGIAAHGTVPVGPSNFSASVGYSLWPPLGPLFDDALQKRGGTFAVQVAPGEYRLTGWFIRQGYINYRSTDPIDIVFTVEPGRATYLGNVHFESSGAVTLQDRRERDLPIIESRVAALTQAPLSIALAPGTRIENLGKGMARSITLPPPVIFIPVKR